MNTISLLTASLLCCVIASPAFAAQRKYGDSANNSDALFDPSRVIQIEIRLDPQDWHALRISHPVLDDDGAISVTKKGYEYCKGDLVFDGKVVASVGVRKKGSWGTVNSVRPSLKIKLDEYVEDREFSGLDMLTLNNCLHDPTKAQQLLVYSFMRKAGVPAPRCNLARVIVNGEDLGIYANVESIRKPFIKRHFKNTKGDLHENVTNADLTTNMMHDIVHKWGNDRGLVKVRKLVDVLERPGPVSMVHIEELIDLKAFITFWAAEVLIGHPDSYPAMFNNFYLYHDAESAKFFFIPWGADTAFVDRQYGGVTVPKSVKAAGYLCQRLWEVPEIQERYRKEMRRLLDEAWDEKQMLSQLDQIQRLCRDDRGQDPEKVRESAARIVRFVEGRRKELLAELDGPAPAWPANRRATPKKRSADTNAPMQIEGSFSAVIVESFPPPHPKTYLPFPTNVANYFEQGTGRIQFTVDGQTRRPFTRFGAAATIKDDTVIRISASDPASDLLWNVMFHVNPYCIATGVTRSLEPWVVHASVIQGDPHSPKAQFKWGLKKNGSLTLEQVSTNLGGTISGKFKINTTAFEEEKKQ